MSETLKDFKDKMVASVSSINHIPKDAADRHYIIEDKQVVSTKVILDALSLMNFTTSEALYVLTRAREIVTEQTRLNPEYISLVSAESVPTNELIA